LAREGARVIINGLDPARLEQTASALRESTGAEIIAIAVDVGTEEGRAALLEAAGDVDILINNNGGPSPSDFRKLTHAQILAGLEANMLTPIALVQAVIDGMIARKFGRIVNITSMSVKMPIPMLDLSSGARIGLTGFLAGVARQVAADNVTINNAARSTKARPRSSTRVRSPARDHPVFQGRCHRLQRPEKGHDRRQGRAQQPHLRAHLHPARHHRHPDPLHPPPQHARAAGAPGRDRADRGRRPQCRRRLALASGSGIEEGAQLPRTIIEYYYKDDALGDPMITEEHIACFGWASQDEMHDIADMAIRVNDFMSGLFAGVGIRLVDFKLEFGRLWDGDFSRIILADEISPDGCRLWDMKPPAKSSTRTASGAIWAAKWKPIRKSPGAWGF
jgi:NAD(P)-dependent dehydrogenase (short-subunit alcohol dehydrogenase family)